MNRETRWQEKKGVVAVLPATLVLTVGIVGLFAVRSRSGEMVPVSSSGAGGDGYRVVYSTTNFSALDHDGVPQQTFSEVISGYGMELVNTGTSIEAITDTGSTKHMTTSTASYYPQLAYLSTEDHLDWWSNPRGPVTSEVTADFVLTTRNQDWGLVEGFIASGGLQYLGEQTICGHSAKGARRHYGTSDIDGWFVESEGLRLRYAVSRTGEIRLLEECVEADLAPALQEVDFELPIATVWATHTLSVAEIGPYEGIHGYSPVLIITSTEFSPIRSYSIDRYYEGIYSYNMHDWPAGVASPSSEPLGWMVVQDLEDGTGSLLRIAQYGPNTTAPLPKAGLHAFEWQDLPEPDPGQIVTTTVSANPIIRDELAPGLARWTDDVGGGQFAFRTSGGDKPDDYLRLIVADLVASRE